MSEHIHEFYPSDGSSRHFHQVIALHESPDLKWDAITDLAPFLPRGWYELSRLSSADRVEFTREYWESKLPIFALNGANLQRRLYDFFENLDEVGIYATQTTESAPFDVHMVYSLEAATGFYQGRPPASDEAIESLIRRFGHVNLPPDYLAFLKIHDGFSKYTDTGLIHSRDMSQVYQRLQHLLAEEMLVRPDGEVIDPRRLIPFYESFGLHCYQCFYADWYPEEEMGNLYFSEHERSISNYLDRNRLEENLAFPTFLGWLIFYLEDIWHL